LHFLLHLAESGLSKRTIQNHVDNMWLLGGEIIRDVNEEPRLRKSPAEQPVRAVIHEDGGRLIHNGWEHEQRSLYSTCREFHRFLTQSRFHCELLNWQSCYRKDSCRSPRSTLSKDANIRAR
jgi:hypothetical protein